MWCETRGPVIGLSGLLRETIAMRQRHSFAPADHPRTDAAR